MMTLGVFFRHSSESPVPAVKGRGVQRVGKGFLRPLLMLLLIVSTFLIIPLKVSAGSDVVSTTLTLDAPERGSLGEPVRLVAALSDGDGKPVSKATITLYTSATFLSVTSGPIEIGRVTTDDSGIARFDYVPTRGTETEIRAEYQGERNYAPAQATARFPVLGNHQLIETEAGFEVPFLNKWFLVGLLTIIWSLYFFVVSRVFRIAQIHRA